MGLFGKCPTGSTVRHVEDNLALAKARERLERTQQLDNTYQDLAKRFGKFNRQMGKLIAPFLDTLPELRHDSELERSPCWLLSSEVSRMVGHRAQIVLWEVRRGFRPAIYCSDVNTALYIHTFFIAPTGDSYASLLLSSGASLRVSMELMRHSTPEMTLGTYAQTVGNEKRDAGHKVAMLVLEGGTAA